MSQDERFYTPNHTVPARKPTSGEPLWSFRKAHVTWSCELRFQGESYGWEAQILRDGELVIGRRFVLKGEAVRWAEEERLRLDQSRELKIRP